MTATYEQQVARKRRLIFNHNEQLKRLLDKCPHTTTKPESRYYSAGYDYVSESIKWDECVVCGAKLNVVTRSGTTYG